VALDASGAPVVLMGGNGGFNCSLIRIDPQTGQQTAIVALGASGFGHLGGMQSIEIGQGVYGPGTIFLGSYLNSQGQNSGTVYAVDPASNPNNPNFVELVEGDN